MRRRLAAWLCMGWFLHAHADPSREVAFWQARCERDPADAVSPAFLGQACLKQLRLTGRASWEPLAESALQRALDRDPRQGKARVALVALYLRQHRLLEAENQAEALVRDGWPTPEALAARGDVRMELGRLREARADLERVAASAPGWAAESRLARLEFLEGHPEKAVARLDRLSKSDSAGTSAETRVLVALQLGELRFRSGDMAAAETSYQPALMQAPDLPVVRDHLAELRAGQGRTSESITLFEALARETERPEYQQAVGDLRLASGDSAGARDWHDAALEGYRKAVDRGDHRYDHHLAMFFSDVRLDGTAAVRWAQRDFSARPTSFAADALAWALHRNGDDARAREVLAPVLGSGFQDASLFFHAAMIFLAAGDKPAGKHWLARAASVNPRYTAYHFHR